MFCRRLRRAPLKLTCEGAGVTSSVLRRSKHNVPIPLHARDGDAVGFSLVERLGERAQSKLSVVGSLPGCVVMAEKQREPTPRTHTPSLRNRFAKWPPMKPPAPRTSALDGHFPFRGANHLAESGPGLGTALSPATPHLGRTSRARTGAFLGRFRLHAQNCRSKGFRVRPAACVVRRSFLCVKAILATK
jgi:hypothetical protein